MKLSFICQYDSGLKDYIVDNYSFSFFGYLRNCKADFFANGSKITLNTMVNQNEKIEIVYTPIKQEGNHSQEKLDIVYEDDSLIVINKPFNLATCPSHSHPDDSVYNRLLTYFESSENTIHFISRLDKDTSGLLLVAKNQMVACLMNKSHQQITKKYLADTYYPLPNDKGIINKKIGRVNDNIRGVKDDGHEAITEYKFIGKINDYYRYELKLDTGRCHQIRVHLSSEGAPIVNDVLYAKELAKKNEVMHLHAYYLSFIHPLTGKVIELKSEPNF